MDLWIIKTFPLWNSWQLHFMYLLIFLPLSPARHPHRGGLEAEWIHRIKTYFVMGTIFLLLQRGWHYWEVCLLLLSIIRATEDLQII